MFEDSTFESGGRIKTKSGPWMVPMFIGEAAILILMILIPLIYPEALPRAAMQMAWLPHLLLLLRLLRPLRRRPCTWFMCSRR